MPVPLPHPNIEPPPGTHFDDDLLGAKFAEIQRNFDALSGKFPVQPQDVIGGRKTLIAGIVKSNGEREAGSGFTSARISTGQYSITLSSELPTPGSLVVLVSSTENLLVRLTGVVNAKKEWTIAFIISGTLKDSAFHFHVKAT